MEVKGSGGPVVGVCLSTQGSWVQVLHRAMTMIPHMILVLYWLVPGSTGLDSDLSKLLELVSLSSYIKYV